MIQSFIRQLARLFPALLAFTACSSSSSSKPWVGKTYLLDTPTIDEGNWTEPKGIGSEVGTWVPQFLIRIESGSGDDLDITLATARGGIQDSCNPTTQVTATGANYPASQIIVSAFPMRIEDTNPSRAKILPTTVHDVILANVLPGDSPTTTSELTATIDFGELYPFMHVIPDPTPTSACETFKVNGGIDCEKCAFNQQPYCMTIKAVEINSATEVQNLVVKKVSAGDISSSCK
jgi:hypothetical protein